MQTLNEVIKALHYWDTCDAFPESFYDFEVTRDALHYLKEYRDYRNADKTVIEDGSVSDAENNPLTWDELKTMKGKPVWVEVNLFHPRWFLIEEFGDNRIVFVGKYSERVPLYADDLGWSWQAYRKERE